MADINHEEFAGLELNADLLTHLFGDEKHYGEIEDDENDGHLFPDGRRWSICTSWANYVVRVLGARAISVGFFEDDNPTSEIGEDCGGHDFAIVDGRWIVDGWLREVAAMADRVVFDLENPADHDVITRLYGDREKWSNNDFQCAGGEQRETAMRSACFQVVLEEYLSANATLTA